MAGSLLVSAMRPSHASAIGTGSISLPMMTLNRMIKDDGEYAKQSDLHISDDDVEQRIDAR